MLSNLSKEGRKLENLFTFSPFLDQLKPSFPKGWESWEFNYSGQQLLVKPWRYHVNKPIVLRWEDCFSPAPKSSYFLPEDGWYSQSPTALAGRTWGQWEVTHYLSMALGPPFTDQHMSVETQHLRWMTSCHKGPWDLGDHKGPGLGTHWQPPVIQLLGSESPDGSCPGTAATLLSDRVSHSSSEHP